MGNLLLRSSRPDVLSEKGGACNFIKKEALAQVFSCEFCEISKNTFFYKTPLVAASGYSDLLLGMFYLMKCFRRCCVKT